MLAQKTGRISPVSVQEVLVAENLKTLRFNFYAKIRERFIFDKDTCLLNDCYFVRYLRVRMLLQIHHHLTRAEIKAVLCDGRDFSLWAFGRHGILIKKEVPT